MTQSLLVITSSTFLGSLVLALLTLVYGDAPPPLLILLTTLAASAALSTALSCHLLKWIQK